MVYGRGAKAVRAIDDVNFDATEGEYVSVVGPSGAGKTTLLKCLSDLLPITSGTVDFLGPPTCGPPEGLPLVFQDYSRSLAPWMSVYPQRRAASEGAPPSKGERPDGV